MITLLITLVVLGFIAWLCTTLIPMSPPFPQVIIGVFSIIALLIILQAFGVHTGFEHIGWK